MTDVNPLARAPNGIDPRRIRVALQPRERALLERCAKLTGRTLSAQARIFMLRGMRAEMAHAAAAQNNKA